MNKNSFENLKFHSFIVVHSFIGSISTFRCGNDLNVLIRQKLIRDAFLTIYSKLILKDDGTLDFIVYLPTVICPSLNRDSSIMCFAFHSNLQCHRVPIDPKRTSHASNQTCNCAKTLKQGTRYIK